jgi:hypothetical protein
MTQFYCFTSTGFEKYTEPMQVRFLPLSFFISLFSCFTSTNVQILAHKALQTRLSFLVPRLFASIFVRLYN